MKRIQPFLALALALLTGCVSYEYRVIKPVTPVSRITDQPVTIMYEPLEYRLSRYQDRLGMTIINSTADQINLRGDRSFVVDPRGETHPVRGRLIAPQSYAAMLWPARPEGGPVMRPAVTPFWDPFWGFNYGPGFTVYNVHSPFDWNWGEGQARIRLSYEQNGRNFFHDFVIDRQREK
ncbi:MAG TPA: hypothetical protein VFB72_01625 [Verrucomicrobiae bacterium]|nr:hypothetical protein [Verrucomicrobiae bacterium]